MFWTLTFWTPARLLLTTLIVVVVLMLIPCVVYLYTWWKDRNDKFLGQLSPCAIGCYFALFYPGKRFPVNANLQDEMKHHLVQTYGRRRFIIPLLLLFATASAACLWIAKGTMAHLGGPAVPGISLVAIASLCGAFSWVLLDQIDRYRTRDFTPHDIYNYSFRILLAVPMGLSFAAIFTDQVGAPLAFMLGAFPTKTLWTYCRRIVSDKYKLGDVDAPALNELEQLQGINRVHAERFQEERYTTIAQLAWADPVDLAIRTNLEFNFVCDCVGQALLWIYVTDKLPELRRLSLRGAMEVIGLRNTLQSSGADERKKAQTTLEEAAKAYGVPSDTFAVICYQVGDDPYADFLYQAWPTCVGDGKTEGSANPPVMTAAIPPTEPKTGRPM